MDGARMLVEQSAYDARFEIHHGNLLNPFTISTQAAHLQAKLVMKKNLAIYMQVRVKRMRDAPKLRCTCNSVVGNIFLFLISEEFNAELVQINQNDFE